MIPALFVFHNDTCDTMTLVCGDILCAFQVSQLSLLSQPSSKKSDRAVTIGTIKIGAVLSYLAYLIGKDEKLFAAVSQQIFFLFLQISLLTKCAFPFRALSLLPTSVGADWQSKVKSKLKKIKITIELFIHDKKAF